MTYTGVKKIDGKKKLSTVKSDRYLFRSGDALPDAVDWRDEGAVSEVKDQGSCGKFLCFFKIFVLVCF